MASAESTEEAVDAARKSDVIVAVVGITAQLEGEESEASDPGFFGGDRTDITLPATQHQLLEALAATGKPLVVVLTSGSAMAINWANEHAAAILEAWYPGEEGGNAVADVLSGAYNPAGRLPVTFYKSVAQLPPFTDYNMANRTYRYLNETPLYPFGFGLSYSTFSYSEPLVASAQSGAQGSAADATSFAGDSTLTVSAKVTNTSSVAGDEVVELYVSHPGVDGAPIRALGGFQRIHLGANASQKVDFTLTPRELSIVNNAGQRLVPTGPVELWVGSSQPAKASKTPSPGQPAVSAGVPLKFTITTRETLPN